MPDRCQNVVDALHCRRESLSFFAECSENRPVTVRSAKSLKILYSAMVRGVNSDPESVSGTESPPKVD